MMGERAHALYAPVRRLLETPRRAPSVAVTLSWVAAAMDIVVVWCAVKGGVEAAAVWRARASAAVRVASFGLLPAARSIFPHSRGIGHCLRSATYIIRVCARAKKKREKEGAKRKKRFPLF